MMEDRSRERGSKPKSRQSLAHVPSKFNTTTDISALRRAEEAKTKSSRSRGKSIGPGGLEALTETNANAFRLPPAIKPRSILKPTVPLTPPKAIPSFDELRNRSTTKAKSPLKNSEDLLIDFSTPGSSRNHVPGTSIPGIENLVDPFSPIARPAVGEDQDEKERRRQEQKKAALERQAARRKSLGNRRVSFAPEATLHTWSVMELVEDSTTSSAANSTRRQSSITAAQSPKLPVSTPARPDGRFPTPEDQMSDEVSAETPESQRELHQRKRRRTSDVSQTSEEDSFSSPGDGVESSPIRVEDSIDSDSDTDGDTAMSLDEVTQNTVRSSASSETQTSLDERLRQAEGHANTRRPSQSSNGREDNDGQDDDDQSMDLADGTVTHAFRQYARKPTARQLSQEENDDKENLPLPHNEDLLYPTLDHLDTGEETMGMTMDMTRAVGGIVPTSGQQAVGRNIRRRSHVSQAAPSEGDTSYGDETMDMTVAKGGILANTQYEEIELGEEEDDMTMEMTRSVGGIRDAARSNATLSFTTDDTESMEMTVAAGGILPPIEEQTEPQSVIEGEYTSAMEITRAIGGILSGPYGQEDDEDEAMSADDSQVTTAMDMTRAVGQILPPQVDDEADNEDLTEIQVPGHSHETTAMEMTKAMGNILSLQSTADEVLHTPTPPRELAHTLKQDAKASQTATEHQVMAPSASETGSPTLKPRLSGRKVAAPCQSTTPTTTPRINVLALPKNGQRTPTKQKTPGPTKSASPKRTPILTANVSLRSASPKKLFAKEIRQRESPASKNPRTEPLSLFSRDEVTGLHTPKVVLMATKSRDHLRRRSSATPLTNGVNASPRVTELLSRRQSIGDLAPEFQLNKGPKKQIQFDDPRQIEQEVDLQRAEEHRRESGRLVMEREANEQGEENTTQNLKDMIQSMTPQKQSQSKTRMKGRKSLAVGSAKGLLGKRPSELDLDEDEDDHTPKRLKTVSREASPVKKIHLPKPPTAEQTTGRLSRSEQLALNGMAIGGSTPNTKDTIQQAAKTPERTGYFRNTASSPKPTSFEERLDNVVGAADVTTVRPADSSEDADEKISLQDFLNMTNVHFIELSTTKRRHTLAVADMQGPEAEDGTSQASFMAAATTLPLLDLYQHATRELKSYISSGRKIVRQIETETLNDQPPIFKQYVEARPDAKAAMDNQFRIGKTNARLQSKEGWYSWRTQLVDGLHTGLDGIRADLEADHKILSGQQVAISSLLPELQKRKLLLTQQAEQLQRRAEEYNSVDHAVLQARRQELSSLDLDSVKRAAHLAELKAQLGAAQEQIASAQEMRHEMTAQITEAVRVQEEQRRWPAKEVLRLKNIVDEIETDQGWRLLTAELLGEECSVELTLQYQKQLRLSFDPAVLSGNSGKECRPPHVSYQADEDESSMSNTLSLGKQFILDAVNSKLAPFTADSSQSVTRKTLLTLVSHGWTVANQLQEEVEKLETRGIVRSTIANGRFVAKLMLMLPKRSRVDISFISTIDLGESDLAVSTSVSAAAVYGDSIAFMDASKCRKVENALTKEIEVRTFGESSWLNAVLGFEDWMSNQSAPPSIQAPAPVLATVAVPPTQTRDPIVITTTTRARTTSPVRSTTPRKAPSRSPLAPKTTNSKAKKLPVPKKILESMLPQPTNFRESQRDKENQQIVTKLPVHEEMSYDEAFGLKNGIKPAIAPEVQEAMMHTPVKRRAGALRRSPI